MPTQAMDSIRIRLVYDGIGPAIWDGDGRPDAFGIQDKEGTLHPGVPGVPGAKGTVVFELTLQVKSTDADAPVFAGTFVHGPPAGRFLYLGWRNAQGAFAQRLKLPLASITWADVRQALDKQEPLVGTLVDHHPKATTTGANIGGTRAMAWALR